MFLLNLLTFCLVVTSIRNNDKKHIIAITFVYKCIYVNLKHNKNVITSFIDFL